MGRHQSGEPCSDDDDVSVHGVLLLLAAGGCRLWIFGFGRVCIEETREEPGGLPEVVGWEDSDRRGRARQAAGRAAAAPVPEWGRRLRLRSRLLPLLLDGSAGRFRVQVPTGQQQVDGAPLPAKRAAIHGTYCFCASNGIVLWVAPW